MYRKEYICIMVIKVSKKGEERRHLFIRQNSNSANNSNTLCTKYTAVTSHVTIFSNIHQI